MKNILPRDEIVWLLIADSVQLHPGGKISLLGFIGTESLQIAADTVLPTALPVTFVFLLREGIGNFSATFQIRDPAGNVAHAETLANAQKTSPTENHGIAVTLEPLIVSSFGVYRLTLTLDGKRYRRTFTVSPDASASSGVTKH